jgi:hypothetical protein
MLSKVRRGISMQQEIENLIKKWSELADLYQNQWDGKFQKDEDAEVIFTKAQIYRKCSNKLKEAIAK